MNAISDVFNEIWYIVNHKDTLEIESQPKNPADKTRTTKTETQNRFQ